MPAAIGVLLAGAFACRAETPARVPVEVFAQLPRMLDPSLSPDGKHYAAITSEHGHQSVAVANPFDPAERPSTIEGYGRDLLRVRWANDFRLLISVGQQQRGEGRVLYATRVVGVDRTGENRRQLGTTNIGGDGIVFVPPEGGSTILMGQRRGEEISPNATITRREFDDEPLDVYRINVNTGSRMRVQRGRDDIYSWFADSDGVVRFGLGYQENSNQMRAIYRAGEDAGFKTISRIDLDAGVVDFQPLAFPSDTNLVIVASNQPSVREGIYEFDIARGAFGKAVYANDRFDINGVVTNARGDVVLGAQYIDDFPQVRWLTDDMRTMQERLDRKIGDALPGAATEPLNFSADMNRVIVRHSAPTRPPVYYVYDRRRDELILIGQANPDLDSSQLAAMQPVNLPARDGTTMRSYLTLPQGRTAKNLPMVLLPHGGPWARDFLQYDYWVQFLANRGYAVLQPNYRGSTGFGRDFVERARGQWGKAMQEDLEDAVGWAVSQGIADPKRVCIMGGSYGGYAALMGIVKTPALYRCAISLAGISDVAGLLAYDRRFFFYKPTRGEIVGGAGIDPDLISPVRFAAQITAPTLLVHGASDIRVPSTQSERMAQALRDAGKDVTFIKLDGADHAMGREQDRRAFLQAVDAFLEKYNPAN